MQIASYKNSDGDVKYSIADIVSDTVITVYGTRWGLD